MIIRIKKLICYIWGHDYDQVALDNNYLDCLRCEAYAHYSENIKGEEFYDWRIRFWHKLTWPIKNKFERIKWKIKDFWKYKIKKEDDSCPF